MAKKCIGKFVAFAALTGAVAAGVSYFLKYKSFNKELDEEFHDFEGDDDEEDFDGSLPHEAEALERTYVTLSEKKSEAKEMAQEAAEDVKDMAGQAVETVKDAVQEAVKKAEDMAETATIEDDSSAQS